MTLFPSECALYVRWLNIGQVDQVNKNATMNEENKTNHLEPTSLLVNKGFIIMAEKRTFFVGPTRKILSRPDGIILPAQIHNKVTYASSLYIAV